MSVYHLKQIPSETQIKKFLRRILYGKNVFCPVCKTRRITLSRERYWCSRCRRRFSLLSFTWLKGYKVSLQKFWLILWCWTKQVPVKQTQELSSFSEKGVRHWFDLFRTHLPGEQEILEHIIQLDEAYFGGWTGFALMMGKQQGTRRLAYTVLPHNTPAKVDAWEFLEKHVKPNSQLHTDGASIYQGIGKLYPVTHAFDTHVKFEFKKTSEIEGMFGVLRTFIRRMYHHVTVEKFPEYMCEFYFRFSHPEMFKSPRDYLTNTLSLAPSG